MFRVITPPHPEFTEAQPPQGQARVKALPCKVLEQIHSKPHPVLLLLARDSPRLAWPFWPTSSASIPDEKPSLAKAKGIQRIFKCLPEAIGESPRLTTQSDAPMGTWTHLSPELWLCKKGSPPRSRPHHPHDGHLPSPSLIPSVPTLSSLSSVLG